jgi:hypothetical protein
MLLLGLVVAVFFAALQGAVRRTRDTADDFFNKVVNGVAGPPPNATFLYQAQD